jgi:23S rRNA (guanosine2251-2'-O)-methyltransferase
MTARRDRHLTVFGRKPVLEVLDEPSLTVTKVFVAQSSGGAAVTAIVAAAARRGVEVERVAEAFVTALTHAPNQHQGVAADVAAPAMTDLAGFLERHRSGRGHACTVLVCDGVTNPANLGLLLRSAAGAGLDGIVVPRSGTADLGPLVVKASAGVAFSAPVIRCDHAAEAVAHLAEARFEVIGLAADAPESLFDASWGERCAFVVGNETAGLSAGVDAQVGRRLAIPLAAGVESLNVACAATLVAFEVARRRSRPRLAGADRS